MLPLACSRHSYLEVLHSRSTGIVVSKWKRVAPASGPTESVIPPTAGMSTNEQGGLMFSELVIWQTKLAFLNGQNWEPVLPGGRMLPSLASDSGSCSSKDWQSECCKISGRAQQGSFNDYCRNGSFSFPCFLT